MNSPISIFWFRRDLRLSDNHGLFKALQSPFPVQPIFIFDTNILDELEDKQDARLSFIYENLEKIQKQLQALGSSLWVLHGDPLEQYQKLIAEHNIQSVFCNRDYEPYAQKRDIEVYTFLKNKGIDFKGFKDHLIFEKDEIVKADGNPYTVYTPYSKKWKAQFSKEMIQEFPIELKSDKLNPSNKEFPSLSEFGFKKSNIRVPDFILSEQRIKNYQETRNFPAQASTSFLSTHLRFGTISPRSVIRQSLEWSETFLNELIWREFFSQILWHFPRVVSEEFKPKYSTIPWRTSEGDFERWKTGTTGYPMVDAGMRQLNATGLMHNRLRMITSGFLCKHLLLNWRWGESYFAQKLLDFELASNNGNWQWAAGTGCDAAPYFRVFNPETQQQKFDAKLEFIKIWIPELGSSAYPKPMVEHKSARLRAIETYKLALNNQ